MRSWLGTCGDTKLGLYDCGAGSEAQRGQLFEDGTYFECDGSGGEYDCTNAALLAGERCSELRGSGAGTGGTASTGGGAGTGGVNSGGSGGSGGGDACTEVWCKDADSDGFYNPDDCVVSCSLGTDSPAYDLYTRKDWAHGEDCYDGNNLARPGIDAWMHFEEDRGDGSFDYDCDGDETPEFDLGSCLKYGVPDAVGWEEAIPECGTEGSFVTYGVDGFCTTGPAVAACR